MLIPVNNFVVIMPLDKEEKTVSGIIIKSDKKKDDIWRGEVVKTDGGEDVKVSQGDIVFYDRYEAKDVEDEGIKYQVIDHDRIIAIIKKGE